MTPLDQTNHDIECARWIWAELERYPGNAERSHIEKTSTLYATLLNCGIPAQRILCIATLKNEAEQSKKVSAHEEIEVHDTVVSHTSMEDLFHFSNQEQMDHSKKTLTPAEWVKTSTHSTYVVEKTTLDTDAHIWLFSGNANPAIITSLCAQFMKRNTRPSTSPSHPLDRL